MAKATEAIHLRETLMARETEERQELINRIEIETVEVLQMKMLLLRLEE
jgi:hypothetical protein